MTKRRNAAGTVIGETTGGTPAGSRSSVLNICTKGLCSVLMLIGRVAAVAGLAQIPGRFGKIRYVLRAACVECILGPGHGIFVEKRAALPNSRIGEGVGCRVARRIC